MLKEERIQKVSIAVIIAGVILALFSYAPSFSHIFRSDSWYTASLSFSQPFSLEGIRKSLSFELFGDPRFEPLSHLLVFIIFKLFKNNFFLHHLYSFSLHLLNAFLLLLLLRRFHKDLFIPALTFALFLNLFSHADTVIWTYHHFLLLQVNLLLLCLWFIFKNEDNPRIRYNITSILLMTLIFFLYEATVFLPLVMILLVAGDLKSANKSLRFLTLIFSLWVLVLNLIYLVYFFSASTSPVSNLGVSNIHGLIVRGITALWISLSALFRMSIIGSLTGPPDYYFGDIVYIVMQKFNFFSFLSLACFFVYYIIFPGKDKAGKRFSIFCMLSAFLYLVAISLGRGTFYTVTQARYFYFPNLMVLIAFSFLLRDLLGFGFPELKAPQGTSKFMKNIVLTGYFLALILANASATFKFNLHLVDTLSPVANTLRQIERFYQGHKPDPHLKLFVNFLPKPKGGKLFLGSQIALETYFFERNIFTRKLSDAEFIYDKEAGFLRNPYYQQQGLTVNPDFTIEFILERIGFLPEVRVIDTKDYFLKIIIEADKEKLLFGGWWNKDNLRQYREFKAELKIEGTTKLVIQKEADTLYFLQDGRIILAEQLGGLRLSLNDSDLFVGHRLTFPTQYCFIEDFLVFIGKPKYNLKTHVKGYSLSEKELKTDLEAIGSRPVFWLKAIKNLY